MKLQELKEALMTKSDGRRVQPRLLAVGVASDERPTPQAFFDALDAEFGFTLDAAANAENAKCARYFDLETDGLSQDWDGVVWVNPPYSETALWVRKARYEAARGATVVMLLPASTDTAWFHDVVLPHAEIRWVRGRLKFEGMKDGAPFASVVVIFRPGTGSERHAPAREAEARGEGVGGQGRGHPPEGRTGWRPDKGGRMSAYPERIRCVLLPPLGNNDWPRGLWGGGESGGEPYVRADLCAAPMELLEAAREALDALELYDMEGLGVCDQLRTAIAKAEGKEATTAPQEGQGGK